MTGLGYAGAGNSGWGRGGSDGGAQWDRGANLKEYYAKRDEQEAQAVQDNSKLQCSEKHW